MADGVRSMKTRTSIMKAKAPRGIGTSLASSTWTRFGTTTHCLKRTNGGVALARKQLLELL